MSQLRVAENPYGYGAVLSLILPVAGRVRLDILEVNGRQLATPVDAVLPAATHMVRRDGSDAAGRAVPGGNYFARLGARMQCAAAGGRWHRRCEVNRPPDGEKRLPCAALVRS